MFFYHGFAIDYCQKQAVFNSNFVKTSLELADFVFNEEKSDWIPKFG